MPHILIIGGSDAGVSAALRARELDHRTEITLVYADEHPNFSVCGLPYYLGGEVADWRSLAHRSAAEIASHNLELLSGHRATAIDPVRREVEVRGPAGHPQTLRYDKLVLGTGSRPRRPDWPGLELPRVHFLHTPGDGIRLGRVLDEVRPRRAAIIGGGYIALEMAEALLRRGLEVSLILRGRMPLASTDAELGEILAKHSLAAGVQIFPQTRVKGIKIKGERPTVVGEDGFTATADLVLVAAGVVPATELAASAGLTLGASGAIQVNRRLESSVPGIWAAGDVAESYHRLLQQAVFLPLGTTAHRQGRIAGENAVGGNREYPGTLGTQVMKLFGFGAARTGVGEDEARAAGFQPRSVTITAPDHKAYYPGARELWLRLTGDDRTGRLLGAQLLGPATAAVAKRIDILATALYQNLLVEELNDLDLAYAPPFSSPWDPIQMAAQAWVAAGER